MRVARGTQATEAHEPVLHVSLAQNLPLKCTRVQCIIVLGFHARDA